MIDLDALPIVPHEDIASVDCCGCLLVQVRGELAEILCNECGAVVRTVPITDIEAVMTELARTGAILQRDLSILRNRQQFPRNVGHRGVHLRAVW